jgi:ParB/RepB/Spo0J family partition protein
VTAPQPAATLSNPTITMLALASLVPSNTHIQELRRKRFDPKLIGELAESIKGVGVLQPILARPLQGEGAKALEKLGKSTFQIVAGERRFLAAGKAGLKEIPATVRELTDEQVLEVQLIENLQREGLHELEEAEGYEELMKLKKIGADAVGDMVGRSKGYVYARVKLLLCPEARQAFYGGTLDASKALLIARIGHHDTQREAMKMITKGEWGRGPMNYREAHKYIVDHFMLRLKSAPFDTADEQLLAKAGSCAKCPKRTGNQKDLFGDVKDADTCTDPKCYDDKRQAHYGAARKKLEDQGKKVLAGDAAKKIFPGWNSQNNWERDRLQGGYQKLSDHTYVGYTQKKVSEVVGDDYEPVLVQHPGTGEILKVATPAAIQAGVAKAKRSGKKAGKSKSSSSSQVREKPDDRTGEITDERFLKAIAEKATGALGQAELRVILTQIWDDVGSICVRDRPKQISAALGWTLKGSGYNVKLPKEAEKLNSTSRAAPGSRRSARRSRSTARRSRSRCAKS